MKNILSKCPVCGNDLNVSRLYCSRCDTTIEGHFHPTTSPFDQLSNDQVQFLLNYVRCEGRFNRLEEELNLSYPTLRNRLNDLIMALGFEPGKEEERVKPTPEERAAILEELNLGRITFDEAQKRLRAEK